MKIETIAIHGGYEPEATTKAVAVPIYQTASYAFDDTQHGADLFDLKVKGNIYTRIMNPTTEVLENRVSAMEKGVGGLAFSSGMAAITAAILNITSQGDNIVSTSSLYGGTVSLFKDTFPKMGIETRFGDVKNLEELANKIDAKTKLIFCESIGNPAANVTDIEKIAEIAHVNNIPLFIDNTVPSPYLCRPIEFGADIVIHSLTKYLCGHGTTIGGLIVDSGKFDWKSNSDKFPLLTTPDPAYHGMIFTEACGPAAFITRARVVPLRNMGGALSPMNSFQILQGIETLAVRMDRHCSNAQAVAEFLKNHDSVSWVNYPGLKSHPDNPLVKKYMDGKASAVLSFGIKGGIEAGGKFIDKLKLIVRLVNIGDAKSLACHPASTTHRQLNKEELEAAGVPEDMVRLSIGIEHIDDIIDDLSQALK
ncbi:MAG: O-acetylhomoserine aminocarboxypropyltransferase/cysteine synthase [Gammaproteobacteria bacterium]|jgi:O-acetylhomoserine (thiol)-lyase|nr:O-acetylhomoserine aminocarboxypropyltransferase/cysteine synthase [Gammaproteobacteria bacterium]MBT7603088.1 O-acetylhomoserine aminocarboxypropyltransferase/cysteine synthase [Gammaproteobacteria bacterium]